MKKITQKFIDLILKISDKIFPKKFNKFLRKILTVEVVLYLFFGVVTTIVNFGTFQVLKVAFKIEENDYLRINIINMIAISLSVLIAYITNKGLVFNSQAKSFKDRINQFWKFVLGRAFTVALEFGLEAALFLTPIPKMISKVSITIIVVILNYFISKFFAFKKK